jgi:hypothetical protein
MDQRQPHQRKVDKHRERQAQTQANNTGRRQSTIVKKEQLHGGDNKPEVHKTPPKMGGERNGPFDRLPQDKWARAFKAEADGDKPLCWFHNNRPGGCTGGYSGVCKWSHAHRPTVHGGKPWVNLTTEEQQQVEDLVNKA